MRLPSSSRLRHVATPGLLARLLCLALLTSALAASASALPTYDIVLLGLTDAEHTRSDGFQSSTASHLTDSGYIFGSSPRFLGAASGGLSTWAYDANDATTTRLGYFDATHTRSDGLQRTAPRGFTGSGYVIGNSDRFAGTAPRGSTAWIYDANDGTTTRLGFFDAAYTGSDGSQSSIVGHVGESGYAAGSSSRSGTGAGGVTWFYDPSDDSMTRMGLFDAAHTSQGLSQTTSTFLFSDGGYAAGTSLIYNGGSTSLGTSAWIYDASDRTNTRVGYYDATHTGSGGEQLSAVEHLTESGYLGGTSRRYGGTLGPTVNQSAWLYDANDHSTTRLGYFDAIHTRSDGKQTSGINDLTESGYAIGGSERYDTPATFPVGSTAWFYDASGDTTTRLGYFDATHTRNDGFQRSRALVLSESGLAGGTSQRFAGATDFGTSAWLYDASDGNILQMGLLDAAHTRNDGYQSSVVNLIAESGFVAGNSTAWDGASTHETSAWIYDPRDASTTRAGVPGSSGNHQGNQVHLLADSGYAAGTATHFLTNDPFDPPAIIGWIYDPNDKTTDILLFSERSDGYSVSTVSFLDEDGFALGSYTLFDDDDASLGVRAFAWTPEDGAVDLGALVDGGLSAAGWEYLATVVRANDLGMIVGGGRLESGGDLAYLLAPVPEPGTGLLVTAGLVGLALRRTRSVRKRAAA